MGADPYALTVRFTGPGGAKVQRERFGSLEDALAALEDRATELAAGTRRSAIDLKVRRFEPIHQVAARLEVRGPRRLAGGVDVRGDGSLEAFTGRFGRKVVEPAAGESVFETLRRVLGA